MITLIATVDTPLQITAFSIFIVPLTRTAGISLNRTNASLDSGRIMDHYSYLEGKQ